jgi:hypothetical protein
MLLGMGSLRGLKYVWNIFGWMFIGVVVATFLFFAFKRRCI